MYLKIDEELKERILETTDVNYEWLGDFLPMDSFLSLIKDLLIEVDKKNEELEALKQRIEDCYRPLTAKEMYGE
jgi:hypothetical protein